MTGDLQHASVFYTVLGSTRSARRSAAALKSATGMLRTEVGKHLNTRLTPSLEFILDAIPENADHIEDLLREARERDEAVAGLASRRRTPATPTRTSSRASSTRTTTTRVRRRAGKSSTLEDSDKA